MSKLTEGFSVQQLISGGAEFEVELKNEDAPDEEEELSDVEEAMLKYSNMECLLDDNSYVEGEPFQIIAKSMTDLIPNGGVKKKILREGHGQNPPNLAMVRVDYNAYIEFEAQPFDSTYSRKKKHEFVINNCEVIEGLDIAVQSMKLTEKSQFLIEPQYAYGPLGCLGRVPQNASVLFEIELCEIIDTGAVVTYNKLPEERKMDFDEVYKYCLSLCARAKDKFGHNVRDALKDYNSAVARLDSLQLKDYGEQEKQQDLLLRLLCNILVCHTKLDQSKRGCITANRIYEMTRGTGIKLKAKVYFSNAKCLRQLGNFEQAQKKLEMARRIEPNNPDIANEFMLLDQDVKKLKKREQQMATALIGKLNLNA